MGDDMDFWAWLALWGIGGAVVGIAAGYVIRALSADLDASSWWGR